MGALVPVAPPEDEPDPGAGFVRGGAPLPSGSVAPEGPVCAGGVIRGGWIATAGHALQQATDAAATAPISADIRRRNRRRLTDAPSLVISRVSDPWTGHGEPPADRPTQFEQS